MKNSKLNKHQIVYKGSVEKSKEVLGKRPDWLKVRLPSGENYREVLDLMRKSSLNTVCEEAKCPNISECYANKNATFLILGNICTRRCGYCNVLTGLPTEVDLSEIEKVTTSVFHLGLKFVVITSPARDDLKDV